MSVKVTPAQYEIVLSQEEYERVRAVVRCYAIEVEGTYLYDDARAAAESLGFEIEEDY